MRRAILATAAVLATMGLAFAADWPQFYGPQRNGVSPESGLAKTWPASGPKQLWKLPLGPGFGGVAVEGGRVYLLDRLEDKQEVLRCLDLSSGKEEWNYAYDAPGKYPHEGSRSTPSVDDKHVFTVGGTGEVLCVDKATHQLVWQKNIFKTYGGQPPTWFVSQSPLLYKDLVIIAPQSRQACLAGLKQTDGQEVWKSSPLGEMQYASPMIASIDKLDQVVMLTRKGNKDQVAVVGVDPSDGKTLWTYDGWNCKIPIPSPTYVGEGRFFITGGYDAGCAMFKVSHEDQKWTVTELFKNNSVDSHLHNAILYKDYLYINGNSVQQTRIGLVCMDLEGKLKWQTREKPSVEMGNLVIADGLLYVMDGNSGTLAVVQASPDGYKELARAKVLSGKGGTVWGPMAIADGKLLCRDQRELKCLDLKNP
jgi:outer membrane protein assembly factor BamB